MAHTDSIATTTGLTFEGVYRLVATYREIEVEGAEVNYLSAEAFATLVGAVDQASAAMHFGDLDAAIGYLRESPVHPG